ncbi:ABC transporter permease [Clostridium sp.]|uniref:ABC transporter permease n=1 Tax=Clostridium sp. TaxID=1506 RepID=UPI003216D061
MNSKTLNLNLIKYELRNLVGNIFTLIFGLFFPIFMTVFLGNIIGAKVPENMKETVMTNIFITSSLIIPLATIFIGYSAVFSQELEKNIPLRFRLFGYSEKTLLVSKICANLIFMTVSLFIYTTIVYFALEIQIPTLKSALILIVSLYVLATCLFILAHGIALFFKKFGPTYGITMVLYFVIMILSGMFGVQAKDFPEPLKNVAYFLPTTYISGEFIDFWQGGTYNFVPYIQSFIFFAAISGITLFMAMNYNKRRIK